MTFHVGQRVTCVRDGTWRTLGDRESWDVKSAVFGAVYVVEWCGVDLRNNITVILLAGFKDWYDAAEFRPVVKPKTDISIFTRMLDPAKVTV